MTIPLSGGHSVIVDDADYPRLAKFKWYAVRKKLKIYGARMCSDRVRYLHRDVVNALPGLEVEHIVGNGLDNRKANLRTVPHALSNRRVGQKRGKTSCYRETFYNSLRERWEARVICAGKRHYVGAFNTEEEAARARDVVATRLLGPEARLNFPENKI